MRQNDYLITEPTHVRFTATIPALFESRLLRVHSWLKRIRYGKWETHFSGTRIEIDVCVKWPDGTRTHHGETIIGKTSTPYTRSFTVRRS